jgi:hypothetical protein
MVAEALTGQQGGVLHETSALPEMAVGAASRHRQLPRDRRGSTVAVSSSHGRPIES